jgi:predicted permease
VALVGHALWRRALSAGDVEGRTLRLDGQALSVAGVMPERFDLPRADVYLPLRIVRASRVSRHLFVIGRLVDGVDLDSARSRVAERATQMSARHPGTDAGWTTAVTPLREAIVGDVRPALWLLLGAAALVSLIACASVANVLLVRFAARRRDLAIRLALGATRGRLARHLVTEGVIVGSAAGAVGVALTAWLLPVLSSLRFPRFDAIAVDGPVILFAVAAGLAMAVVASGVPVMALVAGELAGALSDGGRSATASEPRRFGAIAVVIQVATAVTLLVGATLLGASLANLARVDPGFRADGVLTTRVVLPRTRYPRGDDMRAFERGLVPALQALPGVRLAAVTSALPLSGRNPSFNFGIHGRPADSHAELQSAGIRAVSPSYFSALGIPLVAGRLFEARDTPTHPAWSSSMKPWPRDSGRARIPSASACRWRARTGRGSRWSASRATSRTTPSTARLRRRCIVHSRRSRGLRSRSSCAASSTPRRWSRRSRAPCAPRIPSWPCTTRTPWKRSSQPPARSLGSGRPCCLAFRRWRCCWRSRPSSA